MKIIGAILKVVAIYVFVLILCVTVFFHCVRAADKYVAAVLGMLFGFAYLFHLPLVIITHIIYRKRSRHLLIPFASVVFLIVFAVTFPVVGNMKNLPANGIFGLEGIVALALVVLVAGRPTSDLIGSPEG